MSTPVALVLALCLILAAPWPASGAPGRFDGADRLLEPPLTRAGFFPSALDRVVTDSLGLAGWVGLGGHADLANEDLDLGEYNRYAGSRLDPVERRDLLGILGNSLAVHGHFRSRPLALAWRPPGRLLDRPWTLGLAWEQSAVLRAGLDARVMRTLLLGNEPGQPIVIRDAGVRALVLDRWRLQAAVSEPAGLLPGWDLGLALGLQTGRMAHSTRFRGRLEAPEAVLEGQFEHRLETAGRGRGWFLDLGAGHDFLWQQAPVRLELALRGLVNRIRWGNREEQGVLFTVEPTPIGTGFQVDTFEDALVDSTWDRGLHSTFRTLPPTLELGLGTRPWPATELALSGEFTPARGPHPGTRRISVYGRHHLPAVRGLSLGAELRAGEGRGPGIGLDCGWHSLPVNRLGGATFVCGLALGNRAGILYHSRGVGLGLTGGIAF